ncbi:hypothetical protein NJBCHELONAE_48960 [Mycobacteroides chelonae]|nr:hypothetical protein NJBCHELONAE_48960 [Mycobacteroides chelonae]
MEQGTRRECMHNQLRLALGAAPPAEWSVEECAAMLSLVRLFIARRGGIDSAWEELIGGQVGDITAHPRYPRT